MSRNFLVLVLALLLFTTYGRDAKRDVEDLKNELSLINAKIAKEKHIIANKDMLIKKIKSQEKVAIQNKKMLFPPNVNDSIAFGKIQSFVKRVVSNLGMDFVSSNWGEPVQKEGYLKLPISFIVRCYPEQVDEFLKKMYSYDKLLKIESITIGKFRKEKLVLNLIICGFKLESNNESKSNR